MLDPSGSQPTAPARASAAPLPLVEGQPAQLSVDLSGNLRTAGGAASTSTAIRDGVAATLATVTAANAVKTDGSAVVQPVSGNVGVIGNPTVNTSGLTDSASVSGSVAAPALGASICTITPGVVGTYLVQVVTFQTGTVDTNTRNLSINRNAASVGILLSTALMTKVTFAISTLTAADTINVTTVAAGGVGSIYNTLLVLTRYA